MPRTLADTPRGRARSPRSPPATAASSAFNAGALSRGRISRGPRWRAASSSSRRPAGSSPARGGRDHLPQDFAVAAAARSAADARSTRPRSCPSPDRSAARSRRSPAPRRTASEDRQQHAAARGRPDSVCPIDVEITGVRRPRPPFEHVEPPGIVRMVHAHVVGHEIEDEADVRPDRAPRAAARKRLLAAEFRVERIVIDDVVAVARCRRAPSGKARHRDG